MILHDLHGLKLHMKQCVAATIILEMLEEDDEK